MISADAGLGNGVEQRRCPSPLECPHRLWSPWDMLRVYAEKYIELGQRMADANAHFSLIEGATSEKTIEYNQWLSDDLKELAAVCEELSLKVSTALVKRRITKLPTSEGEFALLLETVKL